MATNFHSEGRTVSITAGATISSGDPVIVGELKGIAATDAASGDDLAITTEGVFELPVASALDVSVGDVLYWDTSDAELNDDNAGNPRLGVAIKAAGVGVANVAVKLG